jgi:hypothetical protein
MGIAEKGLGEEPQPQSSSSRGARMPMTFHEFERAYASQRASAGKAPSHASRVCPNEAKLGHARDRRTNLRLHEMTAGVISLFPAYYLQ